MEIYNAAGGNFASPSNGWEGSGDECTWIYVSCNYDGEVVELSLGDRSLTGTISTWIGELTALTTLGMDNNPAIGGTLPLELYSLTQLENLYLDQDNLSGPIQPQIGNLNQLRELRLDDNNFIGDIPNEIGEFDCS